MCSPWSSSWWRRCLDNRIALGLMPRAMSRRSYGGSRKLLCIGLTPEGTCEERNTSWQVRNTEDSAC